MREGTVNALGLKAAVTTATLLAAVGGAVYVSAHLRSDTAPLHPPVVEPGGGGAMGLTPAVRATARPPLSSTYVS
jgi:hypothetical protein